MRQLDITLGSYDLCPAIDEEEMMSRFRRDVQTVTGHVHNLWPASSVSAQVHVINGALTPGPGSEPPIVFNTLEGSKQI